MKKDKKLNIILMIGTIVAIFFLGEIAVRTKDAFEGYSFFSNEKRDRLSWKSNIIPYRIFGPEIYVKKDNEIYISSTHSELFPLKKSQNTFRIVCLGGSTTHNEWTFENYNVHYPLILQSLLQEKYPDKKIEVINLGYGAYATPHMLILLELDVISWEPDLIIVFENHNDLTAYIYPDFTYDYSNKYGAKRYLNPSYLEDYTTLNAIFRWSSFYWFIKDKWDNIFTKKNIYPVNYKSFGDEPPEINKYVFKRNLLNIFNIANNWGIRVLYATQAYNPEFIPAEYMVNRPDYLKIVWPLKDEYEQHHRIFNDIIKEVTVSTNSYFVDNADTLSNDPENFIDALHYSQKGVKRLASSFYKYIITNGIIEK